MVPLATETSSEEFKTVLARLEYLLKYLPIYRNNFLHLTVFSHDTVCSCHSCWILIYPKKTGDEIATLGEQLEGVFGWNAQTSGDGVLPILECGKAICALHTILKVVWKVLTVLI